ncbi:hypothetical protein C493_12669 [Natronolimnohabitans innermongolicus JCM 12255]|uniref:Uncharacterized protein n=1 Tax=Natronolimnohabitans innermongolicus JCM 12255 TaxID=1227499 RepID=L9WZ73_9EURY|nr:hypothetical protein C493_12669 [Natronolimnohabitans innermongolicus JCM 12255]
MDAATPPSGGAERIEDAGPPLVPVCPIDDATASASRVPGNASARRYRSRAPEAEWDAPLVPDLRPLEQDRRSETSD